VREIRERGERDRERESEGERNREKESEREKGKICPLIPHKISRMAK
jgi:hypothetical protein